MKIRIWTAFAVLVLAMSAAAQDKPDELKRLVELAKEAQTVSPEDAPRAAALRKEAEAIVSRRTGLDPAKDAEKFAIAAFNLLLEAAKTHDPGWHKVLIEQEKRQRVAVARANLKNLEMALDLYRLDSGRYPTTEEGLEVLVKGTSPVLAKDSNLRDPWGNAFVYRSTDAGYELHSCGPDGRDGTPDDVSLKAAPAAAPEPWTSEKWGCSLNLPAGWKIEALETPEGEIVARLAAEGSSLRGWVERTEFPGSCAEYLESVMGPARNDKEREFEAIVEPLGVSCAAAAYAVTEAGPARFIFRRRAIDVAGTKLSLALTCLKKDYEKLQKNIDACEASFASTGVHVITSETWGFEFRLPFGWDVEVYLQAEDNTVARFSTDNAAAYGGIVLIKTDVGAKEYMDRMLKNLGAEKLSDVVDRNGDGSDCHVTFIRKSDGVRVQVYTRVLAASGRLYVLSAGAGEDRYARYQGAIEKSAGTLKAIPSESPK